MACRSGGLQILAAVFCLVALVPLLAVPPTSETEQRDFAILVDGRDCGLLRLTIADGNDGTTTVTTSADAKVRQLIFTYSYSVNSTEQWKAGKLVCFKSDSVENGKRTEVAGSNDGTRILMKVNGVERQASPDVWTAGFWKLADAKYHNKPVPILEPDVGKTYTGQLQYVGLEQITVLHQPQSCYHFRVTGGSYPVEVWFDRYHRLVRQEFVDSGHKTIMQLVTVNR